MTSKIKDIKKKLVAGTILFRLCGDCRIIVVLESINNKGKPLDTTQLCEKCKKKWLDHCEKFKK